MYLKSETSQEDIKLINADVQKEFRAKLAQLMEDYNIRIQPDRYSCKFIFDEISKGDEVKQFYSTFTIKNDDIEHWDLA